MKRVYNSIAASVLLASSLMISTATADIDKITIDDYIEVIFHVGEDMYDGTSQDVRVSVYDKNTGKWSPIKVISGGMERGEKKIIFISYFNKPSISRMAVYSSSSDGLGASVSFHDPFNPGGAGVSWCWTTTPWGRQWIKGSWVYFDVGRTGC